MFGFLANNWGTILVGAIVAGIVVAIVVKMVHDKQKGKIVSCDCGCTSCPKASSCHTK